MIFTNFTLTFFSWCFSKHFTCIAWPHCKSVLGSCESFILSVPSRKYESVFLLLFEVNISYKLDKMLPYNVPRICVCFSIPLLNTHCIYRLFFVLFCFKLIHVCFLKQRTMEEVFFFSNFTSATFIAMINIFIAWVIIKPTDFTIITSE